MGLVSSNDIIVRLVLLQHQPHRLHVVFSIAPVPLGVEIAQENLFLLAGDYSGNGASNFASYKSFAAAGRFVIEQDAVAGKKSVRFAIIYCLPMTVNFGAGVRTSGIKRSCRSEERRV